MPKYLLRKHNILIFDLAYDRFFLPLPIQHGARCYIDYAADDNDYDDVA
jgi:hypothetical protein